MQGYKYIDKIGIELEAAWKNPRKDLVIDESFSIHDFPGYAGVGELVSKPIESKIEMLKWLHDNWPDETCPKCAMHVHFSLNHINHYSACMSNRFYEHFLIEMKKWGDNYPCRNELFWQRLNGENKYCKKRFNPDKQAQYREKGHNRQDRRDHWNFCWGLHQTMECRLLPMFKNIDTAISAINALITCIETYLDNYSFRSVEDELFDFDCGNTLEEDNLELNRFNYLKEEAEKRPFTETEEKEYRELSKLLQIKQLEKKRREKKLSFNYFEDFDLSLNTNKDKNSKIIAANMPKPIALKMEFTGKIVNDNEIDNYIDEVKKIKVSRDFITFKNRGINKYGDNNYVTFSNGVKETPLIYQENGAVKIIDTAVDKTPDYL